MMRAAPDGGDAHLPLHPDRRRGAPRRVLRPLLLRGGRARVGQPGRPPGGDERAPQPELRRALRRDAQEPRGSPGARARGPGDAGRGRSRSTTWSSRACSPSPASTSSSSTTRRWARCPGFVEGFNNVARDEHRHVAFGARFLRDMAQRTRATATRSSARCGVRARGRRRAAAAAGEEGEELFRRGGGDARVRDEGARPAAEGHRADAGRRLAAAGGRVGPHDLAQVPSRDVPGRGRCCPGPWRCRPGRGRGSRSGRAAVAAAEDHLRGHRQAAEAPLAGRCGGSGTANGGRCCRRRTTYQVMACPARP